MKKVLPTMPISALRSDQAKVIKGLDESPALLTNNGYQAAVLISPEYWNEIVELIDRLEDLNIIQRRSKEMDEGKWISGDDVEKDLIAKGLLPAHG